MFENASSSLSLIEDLLAEINGESEPTTRTTVSEREPLAWDQLAEPVTA
jgi:hypothetical protein